MEFTSEHRSFRKSIEEFVEKEMNPYADQWEEEGLFPAHELFKKLGDLGALGITRDPEYGGLGLDFSYSIVMAEALGKSLSGGVALAIGVQTDMCTPALANFGSDYLKRNYLAPSIAGDFVGCIGVSEPGAGSDVAAIRTTARKDGDDYVINGQKMWITNGTQADWMCMLANTNDDPNVPPHKNKSLIIVPMDAPGVHVERKLEKMGMRSSDTALIFFDDVRVPQTHLVGPMEGLGFIQQMAQFQDERIWGAANTVAGLEEALKVTTEYLRDRKTFGQALMDNQFIHFKISELSTEIQALKALTYRAAGLHAKKGAMDFEVARLASMAKFKSGRLSREVLDWCLQFHGGMGYMLETRINRMYRDVRLISIGGGADEIMLGIIAKLEGNLPSKKSSKKSSKA
mgnify:FL=1